MRDEVCVCTKVDRETSIFTQIILHETASYITELRSSYVHFKCLAIITKVFEWNALSCRCAILNGKLLILQNRGMNEVNNKVFFFFFK